jgi:hypothetical protein
MLDCADVHGEADPGRPPALRQLTFDVAAGFAVRDDGEVRWTSIGLWCVGDGILGVYAAEAGPQSPSPEAGNYPS